MSGTPVKIVKNTKKISGDIFMSLWSQPLMGFAAPVSAQVNALDCFTHFKNPFRQFRVSPFTELQLEYHHPYV
jgi:hypothetical protein